MPNPIYFFYHINKYYFISVFTPSSAYLSPRYRCAAPYYTNTTGPTYGIAPGDNGDVGAGGKGVVAGVGVRYAHITSSQTVLHTPYSPQQPAPHTRLPVNTQFPSGFYQTLVVGMRRYMRHPSGTTARARLSPSGQSIQISFLAGLGRRCRGTKAPDNTWPLLSTMLLTAAFVWIGSSKSK